MPRFSTRYRLPQAPVAAPVLPNLSQQNAANARLAQFPLEDQARQAQIDRANASEAKARYDLGKQIETDRQKTAFYNGLQELESGLNSQGYGIGTKQHAEAFAAYAHAFPLARSSADVDKTLQLHAKVNDDQAALSQRLQQSMDAGKALGLTPQGASFVKGGNVDVRFQTPKSANIAVDAAKQLASGHALTPVQFQNLLNAKQGVIDPATGAFTDKFAPGQTANAIQFQAGVSRDDPSKSGIHTMPINEFNQYQKAFGQQELPPMTYTPPTPGSSVTPSPSPTPTVAPIATQDQSQIPTVGSKEDYDALDGGAQFMSGGKLFVKPQATPSAADATDTE